MSIPVTGSASVVVVVDVLQHRSVVGYEFRCGANSCITTRRLCVSGVLYISKLLCVVFGRRAQKNVTFPHNDNDDTGNNNINIININEKGPTTR